MFRMLFICFPVVGRHATRLVRARVAYRLRGREAPSSSAPRVRNIPHRRRDAGHKGQRRFQCAANTPTTLTPVLAFTPWTIAVYAPGCRVAMMADSCGSVGAKPLARIAAAFDADCQSSLVAITAWSDERTSVSVGLASGEAMPYAESDGP